MCERRWRSRSEVPPERTVGRQTIQKSPTRIKDFFEDAGYWVLDFVVKGGPRHRWAIHPELQRALRASLARSGHGAEREAPLFLAVPRRERRKPLTSSQVSQRFHRYAREAGLPLGVTRHRARATFITEALDRKCPIEAVQASVGHRCIATTKMVRPAHAARPGEREFCGAVFRAERATAEVRAPFEWCLTSSSRFCRSILMETNRSQPFEIPIEPRHL